MAAGLIRAADPTDTDAIIAVWLAASEGAHGFVEPGFWRARAAAMRDVYLPTAESYVAATDGVVLGFVSLVGDDLAALFVDPDSQNAGIGASLLEHAKSLRLRLSLSVYLENDRAASFYRRHGFRPVAERVDPETGQRESVMVWEPSTA